jgi:hypothetical protein
MPKGAVTDVPTDPAQVPLFPIEGRRKPKRAG